MKLERAFQDLINSLIREGRTEEARKILSLLKGGEKKEKKNTKKSK